MCVMIHGALLHGVSARLVQYAYSDIRTRSVCSVEKSIANLSLNGAPRYARVAGVTLMTLRHAINPFTPLNSLMNHPKC
jgi:hypothetical protein